MLHDDFSIATKPDMVVIVIILSNEKILYNIINNTVKKLKIENGCSHGNVNIIISFFS